MRAGRRFVTRSTPHSRENPDILCQFDAQLPLGAVGLRKLTRSRDEASTEEGSGGVPFLFGREGLGYWLALPDPPTLDLSLLEKVGVVGGQTLFLGFLWAALTPVFAFTLSAGKSW